MSRRGSADRDEPVLDGGHVDALTALPGEPIGRRVPIGQLDPNPNQPRQRMGDLSELMASISTQGIIEPLVVRQRGDRYQIIAGERRYQAAVQVGVTEVPVVVRNGDDGEVIEIALIENLQRKDLTPFEESEALHSLAERFRYTHEELARRLGKSRSTVTEAIGLHGHPGPGEAALPPGRHHVEVRAARDRPAGRRGSDGRARGAHHARRQRDARRGPPDRGTARRLALLWGVHCVHTDDATGFTDMVEKACTQALASGHAAPGERIVITAGVPFGTPGTTNALRIARVQSAED